MKKNKNKYAAKFCGYATDNPIFFLGTVSDGRGKYCTAGIYPETEDDLREAIKHNKEEKLKKQLDSWDKMREDNYYKKRSGAV